MLNRSVMSVAVFGLLSTACVAQTPPSGTAHQPPAPGVTQKVDLNIYPPAKAGQTRHVLTLPPLAQEDHAKVEIFAGKTMMVDCNRVMIGADIDDETVHGWGYNYYVINDVKPAASTMMACPNTPKREDLVGLNLGSDAFIRYNSKLPVIVYAPSDLTVGYKVWKTDGTIQK